MIWPIKPTEFDTNPYTWSWYDKDYLLTPDGEGEYPEHHCKITWLESFPYINSFRNAVDVGCRDGEYSRYLHKHFDHVYCFDYRRRKLFHKNVDLSKITHFKCALGDEHKIMRVSGAGSMTSQSVPQEKWYDEQIYTLDEFKLLDVDYIKIDVDGFELKVIKGAINTIEKFNPILVIEQEFGETSSIKFCVENLNYKISSWDKHHRNVILTRN